MDKKLVTISAIVALLGLSSIFFAHNVIAKPPVKVTICHATASNTNPYTSESVNISSLGDGHGNNGVNPGDIIPPTPNTDFPNGNNWDATGQAIYNNDCNVPTTTPTPTPTCAQTSPTPTPTNVPTTDTPTPTTVDPTATPTPTCTGTTCINIDCNGGGDCEVDLGNTPTPTPTNVDPTATPTPSDPGSSNNNNNGSSGSSNSGSSSSSSSSQQGVLGASTMASTGTFEDNVMNIMLVVGMIVLALGVRQYAKEKSI